MIDILYLAHGREEFTEASLRALVDNTDWSLVNKFIVYTDGAPWTPIVPVGYLVTHRFGGPVPVMADHLFCERSVSSSPIFAKIDNDVIVPPGWLEQCLDVMAISPELDLLGIEPPLSRTANPATGKRGPSPDGVASAYTGNLRASGYASTDAVGGIGLFRRSAFTGRPLTSHSGGRGGFTDWQLRHPEVTKGWIVPPLKLFLLDRLPMAPWVTLSERYEAEGIQRKWTRYTEAEARELAGWWLDAQAR